MGEISVNSKRRRRRNLEISIKEWESAEREVPESNLVETEALSKAAESFRCETISKQSINFLSTIDLSDGWEVNQLSQNEHKQCLNSSVHDQRNDPICAAEAARIHSSFDEVMPNKRINTHSLLDQARLHLPPLYHQNCYESDYEGHSNHEGGQPHSDQDLPDDIDKLLTSVDASITANIIERNAEAESGAVCVNISPMLGDNVTEETIMSDSSESELSTNELDTYGDELQELLNNFDHDQAPVISYGLVETSVSEDSDDDLETYGDELEKLLVDNKLNEQAGKEGSITSDPMFDDEAVITKKTEIKWKMEPSGEALQQLINKKVKCIKNSPLTSMAYLKDLENGETVALNLERFNQCTGENLSHEIHKETFRKHLESRADEKYMKTCPKFPSGNFREAPYRTSKRGSTAWGYKYEMNNLDEMVCDAEEDFTDAVKEDESEDIAGHELRKKFRHYKEFIATKRRKTSYNHSVLSGLLSLHSCSVQRQNKDFPSVEDESSESDKDDLLLPLDSDSTIYDCSDDMNNNKSS